MVETAVIPRELLRCDALVLAIVKLALCSESHAVAWESVLTEEPSFAVLARKKSWRACWAVSVSFPTIASFKIFKRIFPNTKYPMYDISYNTQVSFSVWQPPKIG